MVLFGERGGTRTLDPMIKSPVMRLLAMGGEGRQGLGPNFGPKLQNTRRNGVVRSDLARRRWPNKDGYNVTTRYRGTRTPSSFKTGALVGPFRRYRCTGFQRSHVCPHEPFHAPEASFRPCEGRGGEPPKADESPSRLQQRRHESNPSVHSGGFLFR
jgi:hypothetical protein